jgi:hypothetical protein
MIMARRATWGTVTTPLRILRWVGPRMASIDDYICAYCQGLLTDDHSIHHVMARRVIVKASYGTKRVGVMGNTDRY